VALHLNAADLHAGPIRPEILLAFFTFGLRLAMNKMKRYPRTRMKISKLLVAVTFHFAPERLEYLKRITRDLPSFADHVQLVIVTNVPDEESHRQIRARVSGLSDVDIVVPNVLGHPYLLTWIHREVFRLRYHNQPDISHFLYLEDDIEIKLENIIYWLEGRERLAAFGLIPSFLRYEVKEGSTEKYATDISRQTPLFQLPRVRFLSTYYFVNLPEPYQATYLLDRQLAGEHLFGPSASPDFGPWNIREKAAQGVTFLEVPKGCFSRNFIGVNISDKSVDSRALIHHIANNYANNPTIHFGKLPVKKILNFHKFSVFHRNKFSDGDFIKGNYLYMTWLAKLKPLLRKMLKP
jgi:hypothetical protein